MKLNEAIAGWWLTNARIKHGHPASDTNVTIQQAEPSGMSNAAKVAIGLVAGAGGLAAAQYMGWLPGSEATPAVIQPAEPQPQGDASLYQYLEDNGYHLPPQ